MHSDFEVLITHEGKPLGGVRVQVAINGESKFTAMTGLDGKVHVTNLPVGEYWLDAELLGVNAGSGCFHVAPRTSRKAKLRINYEWGDLAPATRRLAGRLIESEPGKGGTPIWNTINRTNVPIGSANLRLQNPVTGRVLETTSDRDGSFSFDAIPNGTYVLHVDGGKSVRDYDATDVLIKVSPNATRDSLLLTRSDPGGGSCGGMSLELQ
jgi:WD40 repeat protein